MKENRTKKPPGWKLRVGGYVGHGRFIGHFTMPDGFYFTNEMHQCHIKPNSTARDLLIERAWFLHDQIATLQTIRRGKV